MTVSEKLPSFIVVPVDVMHPRPTQNNVYTKEQLKENSHLAIPDVRSYDFRGHTRTAKYTS